MKVSINLDGQIQEIDVDAIRSLSEACEDNQHIPE